MAIRASFYRLSTEAAVEACRKATSADLRFAWKASRYLTHDKTLKDRAESLERILSRTRRLGDKRGPVLFAV